MIAATEVTCKNNFIPMNVPVGGLKKIQRCAVEQKVYPGYIRPYSFDILNIVRYQLNDPAQYSAFMQTLYKKISRHLSITRFEQMPKYVGIEVEKGDGMSHLDVETVIKKQFAASIISCFSDSLEKIHGFATLDGGENIACIVDSFPILNLSPANGDKYICHICFDI